MTEDSDLPAGDFSSWLQHTRSALLTDSGTTVDCGECTACCSSFLFIQIRPEETQTLGRIRKSLRSAAPGLSKGHVVLGYDEHGVCPLLTAGKCSIYEHRPRTCRTYDCRVFAAAGVCAGGGDKSHIDRQVKRWKFNYPSKQDREEHLAVQNAARFVREHAECFPGGRVPGTPGQLAILAIRVYDVFLHKREVPASGGRASIDLMMADAIVEACRRFDQKR